VDDFRNFLLRTCRNGKRQRQNISEAGDYDSKFSNLQPKLR